MKFTFSWLKDHLETEKSASDIAEALIRLGVEVESLEDMGAVLKPFIIGEVIEATPHPDADRLRICKVNLGSETTSVVCGGVNARAGIKVVFAGLGLSIPSNGMVLKPVKIRGQESAGMLCSYSELLLEDTMPKGSIIELPEDAPVGTSYADYLGLNDMLFDVSITPNRTDVLGVRGIARDLSHAGYGDLKTLVINAPKAMFESPMKMASKLEDDKACPLFMGTYIKAVKNGESPLWLQNRLKAIGLRPISALVDVTNYLTFDLARPLHVFDAKKIQGEPYLRLSKKGETFEGLDDKIYTLDEGMTVICDDTGVISLAGVMGGKSTGCDENTTEVYLECALFDPIRTAITGRKLGIITDARYRFERGVDPAFVMDGILAGQGMIEKLCGGEFSKLTILGAFDQCGYHSIPFLPAQFEKLTGIHLSEEKLEDLLEDMDYGQIVDDKTGIWYITPPSYAHSITNTEAVIGEILRIYGFENIGEEALPAVNADDVEADPFHRALRAKLCARGLSETLSFAFTDAYGAETFGGGLAPIKLDNPMSQNIAFMRPHLLPNLLEACAHNQSKGFEDTAFFEASEVYHGYEPNDQQTMIVGVRKGYKNSRDWRAPHEKVDLYDVKADMMEALAHFGLTEEKLMFDEGPSHYHPYRSATVKLGHKVVLGSFGEVHPKVLKHYDLKGPVVAFELYLDAMPKRKKAAKKAALKLSNLQPLKRDFAFIVPSNSNAKDLLKALKGVSPDLIENIDIFDVYEGDKIGADKRSLAVTLFLQPKDKTLEDADLKKLHEDVVAAAEKSVNAELRDGHV